MLRLHWSYVAMSARHCLLLVFETPIFATSLAKYCDLDFRKLQKVQPLAANFEYWQGFYMFFERATKSLTRSAYPMFEANGPREGALDHDL